MSTYPDTSTSVQYLTDTLNTVLEYGSQYLLAGTQYVTTALSGPIITDPMERKSILYVGFNQDCSSLAVGHEDGYTFYDLRSIDKLSKSHEGKIPERAFIVERLYVSSLITIVSMKTTRKLQVYHSIKENEICCHTYPSSILTVKMNRKRVVVCLENSIHIHNVRDMRLIHIIKETPPNPLGIMDLSNDETACFLAFPGSNTTGHVHIYDAEDLKAICQISAHSGPLACLKFNPEGTKLATASNKGTVIRIFSIPTGDRLFEFMRGLKRCVQISSLAFSIDSRYLCSSSNTETVHVFTLQRSDLQQEQNKVEEANDLGISAWVNYFSQQATAYLPTHMNDLMLREKSTTIAKLPIIGSQTVVAMPRINGIDYLLVASIDGYLFCYTLAADGGECTLYRQYRIGPGASEGENDDEFVAQTTTEQKVTIPRSTLPHQKSPSQAGSPSGHSGITTPVKSSVTAPPPIPPAPKKRSSSSNDTQKPSSSSDKKASSDHNPFESDDLVVPLGVASHGSSAAPGLTEIIPPADLNDMDEFPPLGNMD